MQLFITKIFFPFIVIFRFLEHKSKHQSEWQHQLARTYALSTAIVMPVITVVLFIMMVATDSLFATRTLPYFAIASLLSIVLLMFGQKTRFCVGIYLMVLYLGLCFCIIGSIGIDTVAMILTAVAIILAGTLCGFWCAMVPTFISTCFLLAFRTAELQGVINPAYILTEKPTDFSTILLAALLFKIIAITSSSLNHLQQTRRRLQETEENFNRQKGQLTSKIKQQSQKLRSAESEKMRQLYLLAEAGEISTVLMHDLANNLTSLALEIDGIEAKQNSPSVKRAKKQIRQISEALNRTRQQLRGEYQPKLFNLPKEITRTLSLLRTTAKKAGVKLEWNPPRDPHAFACLGESMLFQQLLSNVVMNAIESYNGDTHPAQRQKRVRIELNAQEKLMQLSITDWGSGITPEAIAQVFEPFYTTKPGGMGMGMYLTKRFIETNFKGAIALNSRAGRTVCSISLPKVQ